MKKILIILSSLMLIPLVSINLQGCQYNNYIKYNSVQEAIKSLKNVTFHIPIEEVQKISFDDEKDRPIIKNFYDDINTEKIWNIIIDKINNYMKNHLKNYSKWNSYKCKNDIWEGYSWSKLFSGNSFTFIANYYDSSETKIPVICETNLLFDFNSEQNAVGLYLNCLIDNKNSIDGIGFENFTYDQVLSELKKFDSSINISKNINVLTHKKFKPDLKNIARFEYSYKGIVYSSIYDYFLKLGKDNFIKGIYLINLKITFLCNVILSNQIKEGTISIMVK